MDEYNDPEPDAVVVRGTLADYLQRELNPTTDVLLAVEASNTTLYGDLNIKARTYARYGVPEYWVVAIPRRELVIHRQPTATGYAEVRTLTETESIAPLSAPQSLVAVADLLPRIA